MPWGRWARRQWRANFGLLFGVASGLIIFWLAMLWWTTEALPPVRMVRN